MLIDVHVFDGKLKGIFTQHKIYTLEEKKVCFSFLMTKLKDPAAIKSLQTITHDLSEIQGSNYQVENEVDASNILVEIIQWIENPDVLLTLSEQLSDITNLGVCPSGRVTRLLQIWIAFSVFKK